MSEDVKRERFRKIAENRTNKILDDLRLLGNCANKSNYSYTDEEVRKIFNSIENELKMTKLKFNEKRNDRFKL